MKKRLIMLALVSAFGLQEFAFAAAQQKQDTTKKEKKVHKRDTLKTKTDTIKPIKP